MASPAEIEKQIEDAETRFRTGNERDAFDLVVKLLREQADQRFEYVNKYLECLDEKTSPGRE